MPTALHTDQSAHHPRRAPLGAVVCDFVPPTSSSRYPTIRTRYSREELKLALCSLLGVGKGGASKIAVLADQMGLGEDTARAWRMLNPARPTRITDDALDGLFAAWPDVAMKLGVAGMKEAA